MKIFFDIETIPSQEPDAYELVRATLKPPATMKLPATIEKWWATEADTAVEEIYRKQSFDAAHGEIISIACADDGEREWVECRRECESEPDLIRDFFDTIERWTKDDAAKLDTHEGSGWPIDDHYLIGHNTAFDIQFLWRRARVLGLPVPSWLPSPLARSNSYGDTMTAWAGFGGRISLDNLCRALRVPSSKEGGIDGSKVFDAWIDGQCDRIATYNLADVVATAACWNRLQGGAL